MSDLDKDENIETAPQDGEGAAVESDPGRWRTASFITIFVVIIMALLGGYRYAIDTRLNDWYLFNVAKHTSLALDFIGYSAVLEDSRRLQVSAAEARASIAAWENGAESASPEAIAAASNTPLDAWEFWSYRAIRRRHIPTAGIDGPHVSFTWRPGIGTFLREKQIERDALLKSEETPNMADISALENEIAELQKKQADLSKDPEAFKAQHERFFSFVVIPECGAIEIMAIFLAAVLAFPTSIKKRLLGALVGIPLMYLVNIFRLTCLGLIGALDQSKGQIWFKFTHEYVWQVVYIVFVVVVWLLWVEFVVRRREE